MDCWMSQLVSGQLHSAFWMGFGVALLVVLVILGVTALVMIHRELTELFRELEKGE